MNIAPWLMKLARVAAPGNRAAWAHAMSAEFAALDRNANHIAWAAGCLGTVVMWRLQATALYLVLLATLPILWNVAIGPLILTASTSYAFSQPTSQHEMSALWMVLNGGANQATLFLISAGLCAYRPRYGLISTIVLWLATTGVAFFAMFAPQFAAVIANAPFSSANNHPALPNIVMALDFAGLDMWPVVVGGFAGWAFARGMRLAVAASGTVALGLIFDFATFFFNPDEADLLSTFATVVSALTAAAFILAIVISSVAAMRHICRAWNPAA